MTTNSTDSIRKAIANLERVLASYPQGARPSSTSCDEFYTRLDIKKQQELLAMEFTK